MSEADPYICCPSHCCKRHGCKYGLDGCPVVNETEEQHYPCENCYQDAQDPDKISKALWKRAAKEYRYDAIMYNSKAANYKQWFMDSETNHKSAANTLNKMRAALQKIGKTAADLQETEAKGTEEYFDSGLTHKLLQQIAFAIEIFILDEEDESR